MPPARCSRPLVLKNSGIHWSEINFRNLFFNESKVSVLATAASNGQKAAGNKTFGFFSFYMGSAIPEYSSNTYFKPTWDEVFDKTKV